MVLGIEVNLLAVFVATIVGHIIGFLWYGPLLGKAWMKMMNFTKDDMKSMKIGPMFAMTLSVVIALITNYILAVFLGVSGANSIAEGLSVGFWLWLGFAMPLNLGVFLWEGRPFKLFLFNTAQYLIAILLAASIIVIW